MLIVASSFCAEYGTRTREEIIFSHQHNTPQNMLSFCIVMSVFNFFLLFILKPRPLLYHRRIRRHFFVCSILGSHIIIIYCVRFSSVFVWFIIKTSYCMLHCVCIHEGKCKTITLIIKKK